MKKLIFVFTIISSSAFAQSSQTEITLKLSQEELGIIGQSLDAMPYGKVAPLLEKLRLQIYPQLNASKLTDLTTKKSDVNPEKPKEAP
jgi:hypothetical protein